MFNFHGTIGYNPENKEKDPLTALKEEKNDLINRINLYNDVVTNPTNPDYAGLLDELNKENPNFLEDSKKRLAEIEAELVKTN